MPLWKALEQGVKRVVAVWHRRAGKDDVCLRWASIAMMLRPAMYWHMLPETSQARKAIWDAVNPHTGLRRIDEAFPKEIRKSTREDEMKITFVNGAVWQVVGSDNYNSLVGSPPAGVIFSEWPLAKQDAWAYLRPILAENGGWAFFIYTPRGENHGKSLYDLANSRDDWFCQLLTADETGVFTKEQLESELDELIKQYGQTRGEALFKQEYYCSFREAFTGKVVYPEFSRKAHVATESLLQYAVEGAKQGRTIIRGWDNTGLSPACVITYINTVGQIFVLKEFCGEDIGIIDFSENVLSWCNEVFGDCKYRDIADPGGRIRDSRKKSPAMYMRDELGLILEDGIQTFKVRRESVAGRLNRLAQGEPAIVIDPECDLIVGGFEGGYCYPEIGNTGMFKPEPEKNKFSHPHDALQYICSLLFSIYGIDNFDDDDIQYTNKTGKSKHGGY